MLDEFERFQGVVLRQIVVEEAKGVNVAPFQRKGRVNAFVLNGRVGIYVKHSAKRLSPWTFTFHRDHIAELAQLEAKVERSFVVFVCGMDGVIAIGAKECRALLNLHSSEQAWIRVVRRPRSMYSVTGNEADLPRKVARGVRTVQEQMHKLKLRRGSFGLV